MPRRIFQVGSDSYRYGFGGQEKSNEIKGEGNSYTAQFWEYDPRLVRRWNIDPKSNENQSPYVCFSNNPINNIDINGDIDSTVTSPDGGKITLPDGAKITGVHNTDKGIINGVNNADGTAASINVAKGSVFRFEFNGDTYNSLYDIQTASFMGYGKNGSTNVSLSVGMDKIVTNEIGVQKPDSKVAMSAGALALENTPGGLPPKIVTGVAVTTAAAILTSITIQTTIHDLKITAPVRAIGGYVVYSKKTGNQLLDNLPQTLAGLNTLREQIKIRQTANNGKLSAEDKSTLGQIITQEKAIGERNKAKRKK